MDRKRHLLTDNVGANLDALVTLDLRGYGVPSTLFKEARRQADGPLVMGAAQAVVSEVKPGDVVFIGTGFVFPPWNVGELDGVVGACAIARAIEIGLDAKPVLIVEPELVQATTTLIRTAGLQPVATAADLTSLPHTALVLEFTKDADAAAAEAARLIEQLSPKAMIAIERPGRDAHGAYHMGNGVDVTDLAAKVDVLFQQVEAAGGVTVAIGDLGNELGLGTLKEAVVRGIPFGATIAAAVPAQHVIVAAVSDWAGYAFAAAISFLTSRADAAVDGVLLGRLLTNAVDTGLIDGSGYAIPAVDGVSLQYNQRLADQLIDIITLPSRTEARFSRMFDLKLELDAANTNGR